MSGNAFWRAEKRFDAWNESEEFWLSTAVFAEEERQNETKQKNTNNIDNTILKKNNNEKSKSKSKKRKNEKTKKQKRLFNQKEYVCHYLFDSSFFQWMKGFLQLQ